MPEPSPAASYNDHSSIVSDFWPPLTCWSSSSAKFERKSLYRYGFPKIARMAWGSPDKESKPLNTCTATRDLQRTTVLDRRLNRNVKHKPPRGRGHLLKQVVAHSCHDEPRLARMLAGSQARPKSEG